MKNLTMPLHARQNAGWKVYDDRGLEFANCHNFDMSAAERESNAAFIVKAVNSHDALVDALDKVRAHHHGEQQRGNEGLAPYVFKAVCEALAKARGEA